MTSYKHNQDVLEVKEDELLLVHDTIYGRVISSLLPQNQQKFLLMNMRLCDIHQGDETAVLLRLDDYLYMNGAEPTKCNDGSSYAEQSLQSQTLTGPHARGNSNALLLQFLYI